ncbi:Myosin-IIIa [Orchesella cincta]|uniref:non-specific serine/threonine protein kinase n=1 Tax=Orchesella cincta TaxID=48709 RepID=A0A1D2NAM2_ORCCI|nr:Myosin-IIIa [Orchesella cincta]
MELNSEKIRFEDLPSPGDKFQLLDIIGEGTYGEVYAAIDVELEATHDSSDKTKDAKVAIKILENLPENMEEAEEELLVLRDYSIHPNLPSFYGLYFKRAARPEDCQLWYVMELCSGGSVTDLAQGLRKFEGRRLTEFQIAYILREVVDALIHLHTHHCIHRDVKGHNILLTGEGRVKLVDFGVAARLKDTYARRNTSIGTPYWMSPEVIACERQIDSSYDVRCDVWSLGITAIELAEAEPPLADLHPMRALFQIPRNPPPTLSKPHDWSSEFNDFVAECLIKDMDQRPFMVELRQHPFLQQLTRIPEDIITNDMVRDIQMVKAHGDLVKREPEVTTKHGKLKTDRKSKLQTMFVDDLVALASLDEETILDQLFHRFQQKQPYTYIGDILIAVNPYEDLGIYNEFYQFKYRAANTADIAPHIYSVADQAYHAMLHQKRSQNIVISGESGAGKTESAKFLLQHFVYLGKAPNRNLESKILHVNPIMEAFGNAATGMNQNSSRFAKYLDVTFTRTGKITGAKIAVYLLEESRVDRQAQDERNFHIFYYLLHGLQSKGRRQEFKLDKRRYSYLQGIDDSADTQQENVEHFEAVNDGFYLLGFRMEEIESIYKILAAILHLGEIRFDAGTEEDGCSIKNMDELETVANLLGVSAGDLGLCLTTRSVVTAGETFIRRNSSAEARTSRDSLARGLYNRIFRWIVYQINALLGISRLAYGDPVSIGLLDIFGFEAFQVNSLEQLCINITNEQLQFLFNQHVFTWEQQEYMAEGINIEVVQYADNRPILELCLGKPLGILSLTDEESRFPQANDWTLLEKLNANLQTNEFYFPPKSNADLTFQVRHYAGKVTYSAKGFVEKNRSNHSSEIIQTLRKSTNNLVKAIYKCLLTRTGDLYVISRRDSIAEQMQKEEELGLASQTRSHMTIATSFRFSLMDLMSKLLGGELHFVRCIKPNDFGVPEQFDHIKVLRQLRYSGVLETIRIRQLGFSHRFTFAEFLKSYCFLAFNFDERVVADKDSCRLLLLRLKLDNWALGKTKVFLKYYHVEYLAKLCEQQIRSVIFVQACVRRWLAKIRFRKGMWQVAKTIISTQRAAKLWLNRKRSADATANEPGGPSKSKRGSALRSRLMGEEILVDDDDMSTEEKAAILIQSHFRGFLVRKQWGPILEERVKQIVLSNAKREDAEKALRDEGLNEEDAALVLQRFYRKWKVTREKSQDEDEPPPEPRVKLDNWDAPFRLMECHMKDLRAGRVRTDSVNILPEQRKLSKFGQQLLGNALEKKVHELRRPSREKSERALDIRAALEATPKPPVFSKDSPGDPIAATTKPDPPVISRRSSPPSKVEAATSPEPPPIVARKPPPKEGMKATPKPQGVVKKYLAECEQSSMGDFRKNLKKAAHRPTDSLKKGWNSQDVED